METLTLLIALLLIAVFSVKGRGGNTDNEFFKNKSS